MSRFKPQAGAVVAAPVQKLEIPAPVPSASVPAYQVPAVGPVRIAEGIFTRTSLLQTLGLFLFFGYQISGFLNDWSLRLFGNKAYISIITLVVLPVFLLLSGNALRGLHHRVGWLWALFLVCLLIDIPFSTYRRGSFMLLLNYVPRSYICYYYVAAFAVSIANIRSLMYVNIVCNSILVLECWRFGGFSSDGRFRISDSLFFSNANDLALSLLLAAVQFIFLLYSRSLFPRILGVLGIIGCLFYMSKTGSRGCMLALFVLVTGILLTSKRRALSLAVAAPLVLLFFIFAPSATLRRFLTFSTTVTVNNLGDLGAIESQVERQYLFKRSLVTTLQHPLFGVGPDQFASFEFGQANPTGEWKAWVGTHNSYTQVSSECGIPALICYAGVLFGCMALAYRVYKRTLDEPRLRDINRISFVLLAGLTVYAVATFFFHMAYSPLLPNLSGTTIALYFASKGALQAEGILLR